MSFLNLSVFDANVPTRIYCARLFKSVLTTFITSFDQDLSFCETLSERFTEVALYQLFYST